MWSVPPGTTTATVTGATGLIITDGQIYQRHGAGGNMTGRTDVTSFGGISGIIHGDNFFFLVGVFLTDEPPSGEGPERLDFTGQDDFDELAPQTGQTFFIGEGTGRTYIVPGGASRLYLGFVDAFMYGLGEPGYYDNNDGQLAVTIEFPAE